MCSFGLIEHFKNWSSTLKIISEFLKPGGLMITTIPNLFGINAFISKIFRPKIYYGHEKISPAHLKREHKILGMNVVNCNYSGSWFISAPLQMSHFSKTHPSISRIINYPFRISNYFLRKMQQKITNFPASKIFSPSIVCIALNNNKD